MSSSNEFTWSGSAPGSASFNSEAADVEIGGTAGAIGIPGAEGIVDRVRRIRRAVATVGVTRRVGIIRVRAQLAPVLTLLIVELGGVSRIGIRRRLVAEGTAVGLKGLFRPSALKGLPAPKGLDVESGLNGFALSSPRSSAWTERGRGSSRNRRRKKTRMAILRQAEQPVGSAYSPPGD